MANATIMNDGYGYYIEWYRDDDNDSGWGGDAMVARWYGDFKACKRRLESGWQPPERYWVPCVPDDSPSYTRNAHSCVGGELP